MENNWIKSVLNVINPKDGTDYWLGGLDVAFNMCWYYTGNGCLSGGRILKSEFI